MGKLLLLLLFALAVIALSQLFDAGRGFLAHPSPAPLAMVVLWLAILSGLVFVLGFFLYALEKATGKVRRKVGVYERWLARARQATRKQDSEGKG